MPPLAFRNAVQTNLQNWKANIDPRQDTFFAANGRYWQGVVVPATVPADGGTLTWSATRKATDCPSWSALGNNLPASLDVQLWIDAYDGPNGKGYVYNVLVKWGAELWTRSLNMRGGETWRTRDWTLTTLVL